MNQWKRLVALCKKHGYEGDTESLDQMKAFAAEHFEMEGDFDIDRAYADRKKKVTISISADAGEEVEVMDAGQTEEAMEDGEDEDMPKSWSKSSRAQIHKGHAREHAERRKAPAFGAALSRRKAYNEGRKSVPWSAFEESRPFGAGRFNKAFDDADLAEGFGAWVRTKIAGHLDYTQRKADAEIVKGMSLASDSGIAPEIFQPTLIELKNDHGAARRAIGVLPMSGSSLRIPRLLTDISATWETEAEDTADTQASTDTVLLSLVKLKATVKITNELLVDSAIDIGDLLARSSARAFGQKEDDAIIWSGDGTDAYGNHVSMVNKVESISGTPSRYTGGATWAAWTDAQLQGALGLLPTYAWENVSDVKWLMGMQPFFSVINRLAFNKGGVNYEVSQRGTPVLMYNGMEIIPCAVCPSTDPGNNANWGLVGAFNKGAKFGENRESNQFAVSEHAAFFTDQIAYRITERIRGNVHDVGDATDAGPIIVLRNGA